MPRTRYRDLDGQRFGRLTVVDRASDAQKGNPVKWKVLCDCGTTKLVSSPNLVNGSTKSCGCIRREYLSESRTTHGKTNTPTYRSWSSMRTRCNNPNYAESHSYKGRGIKICKTWDKFENFLKDMGERPKEMSLDRIDVNGNYEPSNCRWATKNEQAQNKRKTKLINKDTLLNFLKTQSYLTIDQQQQIANNFFKNSFGE
jgi:hypothetical protein